MTQLRILKTEHAEYHRATWDGENISGFVPMFDKVMILPDQVKDATQGGVFLSEDQQWKMNQAAVSGTLVAMGPNAFADVAGSPPKVGDHVYFERYAGQLIPGRDGNAYRVMDASCIGALALECVA